MTDTIAQVAQSLHGAAPTLDFTAMARQQPVPVASPVAVPPFAASGLQAVAVPPAAPVAPPPPVGGLVGGGITSFFSNNPWIFGVVILVLAALVFFLLTKVFGMQSKVKKLEAQRPALDEASVRQLVEQQVDHQVGGAMHNLEANLVARQQQLQRRMMELQQQQQQGAQQQPQPQSQMQAQQTPSQPQPQPQQVRLAPPSSAVAPPLPAAGGPPTFTAAIPPRMWTTPDAPATPAAPTSADPTPAAPTPAAAPPTTQQVTAAQTPTSDVITVGNVQFPAPRPVGTAAAAPAPAPASRPPLVLAPAAIARPLAPSAPVVMAALPELPVDASAASETVTIVPEQQPSHAEQQPQPSGETVRVEGVEIPSALLGMQFESVHVQLQAADATNISPSDERKKRPARRR